MGPSDPAADLGAALMRLSQALSQGRSLPGAAEDFFEDAAGPVSRLRALGPLEGRDRDRVREAVQALVEVGNRLFAQEPEAAVKLGSILSRAKHFAGALSPDPTLEHLLEELYRDWHRRLY